MLFDSHAHINENRYSDAQRKALMDEIERQEKIAYVADIGFNLKSSVLAAKHAAERTWCVGVVGVHPHEAETVTESVLDEIKNLAAQPGVKAIGEIGLDYYYMNSPKEDQIYWFRRQVQLANELRMPIVIHSREADRETLDILIEEGAFSDERKSWFEKRPGPLKGGQETLVEDARVDIHCFSGSAELGREYVKLGATLGICGPLTYKNNKKTVRVVEEVPLEYLMIETDAPYLAPVPFRGKENKPWYVEFTARRLADIKGIPYEEVAKMTYENARRFYGV